MNDHPIRDLQKCLRTLSLSNGRISLLIADGVFGEQTERALKDFQKAYGLEPTGRADIKTLGKIGLVYRDVIGKREPPARLAAIPSDVLPIIPGSVCSCLTVIQAVLKVLSFKNSAFPPLEITGIHDGASVKAINEVKKICSLEQNGIIDKKTWDAIAGIYETLSEI